MYVMDVRIMACIRKLSTLASVHPPDGCTYPDDFGHAIITTNSSPNHLKTDFGISRIGFYHLSMISAAKAYERLQLALSDARRSEGLTQKEVANKLTRPQSFVSKYEKGERRLDVVEFVAVCHALKVDPVAVLENIMGRR